MRIILLLICICSALPLRSYAEGEKITEISVRGNRRIETAAILNAIRIKPGDSLFTEKTDADIRAIFRLGHFQDIRVETETKPSGFILTYIVSEKPVVREIKFEGNKELTIDKLKESIDLRQNSIYSIKEVNGSVAKLKKLYGDEGYYLAEIEPVLDSTNPSDLILTFKISEGSKILIRNINFDGNRAFSSRKLRGVMETKEKWFMSWLTGAGTYKEEVLKNDAGLLTEHYLNNGYINVKVGEPVVKLSDDRTYLEVMVGITEGDQFQVGEIGFKGELLEPAAVLRQKLKLIPGEVFSRAVLRNDIGTLTDVYADKGYAFANVNPLTRPDGDKKTVDITFDMEKSDLVYIERVNITGNTKTRDKVVRREVKLAEGDLYSATKLRKTKQTLMNLGFFEEANISTAKGTLANKLDVNVDVKEKPTGSFSIGGGYSSLDGFIAQGSISQSNFLGLGLKANLSGSFGGKSSTYSVGLTDPYFMDTRLTLGGDIYRSERDYAGYSRRLTGGDIKAGYPLTDEISTFSMYKYEIKELYNIDQQLLIDYPDEFSRPDSTTSSIYTSITRNTTDYRFDPSTGMINTLSLEYAGLGGDNAFARVISENTWFTPLVWKFVLSTKIAGGYVAEVGKPVPIDEKFYLGGIFSLRGYKARTVSPLDSRNNPIGGDKEIFGNLEVTFPLIQEVGLKGVAFFDYGNAYGESQKFLNQLYMSYGGGVRWNSPMGPLRLEYGIPLNPRRDYDKSSGRLEFSIGSLF